MRASRHCVCSCLKSANLPVVQEYVGQAPFTNDKLYDKTPIGVTMGLAWTSMGGDTLYVEAAPIEEGEGKVLPCPPENVPIPASM